MGRGNPPLSHMSEKCRRCERSASRIFPDGLCGICQITAYRTMPGVLGFDHPNERDPDNYDPEKEQRLAIKYMANEAPGRPNHIDDNTAARWEKLFCGHAAAAKHRDRMIPEREHRATVEFEEHQYKVQMDEEERRGKAAEENLKRIDAKIQSGELEL